MAYADYLHCPGCDGKAIYWPDGDDPEGVEVWHTACLKREMAERAAAGRERTRIYLDRAITNWRKSRDEAHDTEGRNLAACYVDAFQSARVSLLGGSLPEEMPQ